MLGLQNFSFEALWSPWFLLVVVLITLVYIAYVGPLRHRFQNSAPVPAGRIVCFLAGAALFYLAVGGPLDLLGHLMFSAHMTSMAVAFLIAVPLMLIGIPEWMARPLFEHRRFGKLVHFLTHPLLTVFLFNAAFSFYHMPAIHDYVMVNFTVHTLYYALLFVTSVMMWWPILSPFAGTVRLSELRKIAYVFANGVLITPACALIIFAGKPLYLTYSDPVLWAQALGYCVPGDPQTLLATFKGPEQFLLFSPTEDQQLGGVIMKVLQEIIYGAALAYIFFSWYAKERKEDGFKPDPILE